MVLMNDFRAEPASLRHAMLEAVARVLDSGWYVLGQELQRFEQEWATQCGTSHAIGVGNGMDAVEIALRALDIGPGDEVITTSMTAFATVLAIIRSGATPILADIDPTTGLLSIDSMRRCISTRTKAVVLVHLYGQIRAMDEWQRICDRHGLMLIEDCAQAHLSEWDGRKAGSFGIMGAYSFYPTKNLGAVGDAGMIVTNIAQLAEKASRLRNYGQSVRYLHSELGLNSRLDEVHAAILSVRLKLLPAYTARRRTIAQAYMNRIHNGAVKLLASPQEPNSHVYHLFVVTCVDRDALGAHLWSHGVQTFIHYPVPVHLQEPCVNLMHDPYGLRMSEQHAASCISLPCHPQMDDGEVETVIEAVNSFRVG